MKKGHFLFEMVLMSISALMILMLLVTQSGAMLYFLAWQALLGIMQFIHALILTYNFKKDVVIWHALRIYWIIVGIVLIGLLFRNEAWLPAQLYTFLVFVLPWFNAIYLTMLTYRYCKKTPLSKDI